MNIEDTIDQLFSINQKEVKEQIAKAFSDYGSIVRFVPVPENPSENTMCDFVNGLKESGLTDKEYAIKSGIISFEVGVILQPPNEAPLRVE